MRDRYMITTPENVPVSYELAGLGSRFVAALLDGVIVTIVQLGLVAVAFVATVAAPALGLEISNAVDALDSLAMWFMAVVLVLSLALLIGYPVLFEIVWNGQTPGKRMTGIRILRDDGGPITATAAVVRNVLRLADFLPAYYALGAVVVLIDSKGRRLGDIAAGTICVKERRYLVASELSSAVTTREVEEAPAEDHFDQLDRLDYEDRRLVQEYLQRRMELSPGPAHDLAVQIAERISSRLDVRLANEPAEDFLVRVGSALERQSQRL